MPKIIETGEKPRVSIESVILELVEICTKEPDYTKSASQCSVRIEEIKQTHLITMRSMGQIWAMHISMKVSDLPDICVEKLYSIETCSDFDDFQIKD